MFTIFISIDIYSRQFHDTYSSSLSWYCATPQLLLCIILAEIITSSSESRFLLKKPSFHKVAVIHITTTKPIATDNKIIHNGTDSMPPPLSDCLGIPTREATVMSLSMTDWWISKFSGKASLHRVCNTTNSAFPPPNFSTRVEFQSLERNLITTLSFALKPYKRQSNIWHLILSPEQSSIAALL